jgi:hypothetical protein
VITGENIIGSGFDIRGGKYFFSKIYAVDFGCLVALKYL